MWVTSQYWPMFVLGFFGVCCFWKMGPLSWPTTGVLARASFEVDLTLPSSSLPIPQSFVNRTLKKYANPKRHRGPVSRYMLQLYHRQQNADIVRALQPLHISGPLHDGGGRVLDFAIPPSKSGEVLEAAELLGTAGMILRVDSVNEMDKRSVQRPRRDEAWRAFNVTASVTGRNSDIVQFLVRGKVGSRQRGDGPILLLSYSKPRKRRPRSILVDEQDDSGTPWEEENGRRRRRNVCRRRPLYVDFATIAYDEWIVAPPGYEAYQCTGKCFFPFGDHLSPTKHAIVQTLVHSVMQGPIGMNGQSKPVSRACCVPTRLAPTSLLYLDSRGTLTYQYGYDDMVVLECGCR